MLYAPAALVVASVDIPVATFRAETLALGIAPPCVSVTVPVSVAPATCARSGSEISALRARTKLKTASFRSFPFIDTPPVFFDPHSSRTVDTSNLFGKVQGTAWLKSVAFLDKAGRTHHKSSMTRETPS